MPRATVDHSYTERIDLKSCPEGYVDLKKMTYGQLLERRDMATKLEIEMASKRGDKSTGEMITAQKKVVAFEFKNCVVDHNLTDENDQPLDFRSPAVIERLDPRIGDEISQAIDKMNQFEEDLGNSQTGSEPQ